MARLDLPDVIRDEDVYPTRRENEMETGRETLARLEARQAAALEEIRSANCGIYGALAAVLEAVEAEDRGRYGSFYGTRAQDLLLLTAARLVVDDPNGCRERFAHLLEAVAEESDLADWATPVLAKSNFADPTDYRPVRSAPWWLERSIETARKIVRGEER